MKQTFRISFFFALLMALTYGSAFAQNPTGLPLVEFMPTEETDFEFSDEPEEIVGQIHIPATSQTAAINAIVQFLPRATVNATDESSRADSIDIFSLNQNQMDSLGIAANNQNPQLLNAILGCGLVTYDSCGATVPLYRKRPSKRVASTIANRLNTCSKREQFVRFLTAEGFRTPEPFIGGAAWDHWVTHETAQETLDSADLAVNQGICGIQSEGQVSLHNALVTIPNVQVIPMGMPGPPLSMEAHSVTGVYWKIGEGPDSTFAIVSDPTKGLIGPYKANNKVATISELSLLSQVPNGLKMLSLPPNIVNKKPMPVDGFFGGGLGVFPGCNIWPSSYRRHFMFVRSPGDTVYYIQDEEFQRRLTCPHAQMLGLTVEEFMSNYINTDLVALLIANQPSSESFKVRNEQLGYTEASAFTMYPNPTSGSVTIETNNETAWQATDLLGRSLLSGIGKITLQLSLSPGVYLVKSEGSKTQRLVVTH